MVHRVWRDFNVIILEEHKVITASFNSNSKDMALWPRSKLGKTNLHVFDNFDN